MIVHAFGSRAHYLDHLLPVFEALPDEVRGQVWAPANLAAKIGCGTYMRRRGRSDALWLVASYADLRAVGGAAVLVEHGAGQTYGDRDPSYSGGADRGAVVLFVCPNEVVAERNREAYPDVPSVVVGCPRLDSWYGKRRGAVPIEGDPSAQRLRHLDGCGHEIGLRPSADSGEALVSPSSGVVSSQGPSSERAGSRLPQHGHGLPGGLVVPAPPMRSPRPPDRRNPSREPHEVTVDGAGEVLSSASRVHPREHLHHAERQEAMSGVPTVATCQWSPVVALSFHWSLGRLAPEASSAWPHYDHALPAFVEWCGTKGITVIGHGHPRIFRKLARRWSQLGVEPVGDFDEVLGRAGVYVADISSTLFEAAAVGVPVVVLSAPWYRRTVDLWPRFWALADVGVQVDNPAELPAAVLRALADPPEVAEARQAAAAAVYGVLDGKAAQRAASAIVEVVQSFSSPTLPTSASP